MLREGNRVALAHRTFKVRRRAGGLSSPLRSMVSLFLEDITEYSPEKYLTSTLDNIPLIDLSQKLYGLLE